MSGAGTLSPDTSVTAAFSLSVGSHVAPVPGERAATFRLSGVSTRHANASLIHRKFSRSTRQSSATWQVFILSNVSSTATPVTGSIWLIGFTLQSGSERNSACVRFPRFAGVGWSIFCDAMT